ncbi:MAG: carbohydrate ABC transporter permease [Actinomycetaceae bacterium]|nr:carbohydrate ABC transporter permease [Actinomycetaceae bacterium]
MAQKNTSLPPVPGSQAAGEPVISNAQRKRNGAGVEHSSAASKIFGYLSLLITVAVILVPIYFIVITSLKTYGDVYSDPISFWPQPLEPGNYSRVMEVSGFSNYLRNSIIITTVLTIIEVSLGVLSAYAFAFLQFPGRNVFFFLVLATLMVPNQITIISNYSLVAQMGMRNTYIGVILPLAAVAFGTYLMRNHFLSLPKEIMEAAAMDGAGFFTTLFKVVLPMSWPTLSAFVLITVVTEWNQYLWPFLITDTDATAPLPVGLTRLQDAEGLTNWGPVMAGTVLTTVPMLIVFLFLQKNMIKGLTAGAVKG